MKSLFDISKFDSYKEDNRREVKKANGGLPASLWDTYSAFDNCYGGVIILGVAENKDGTWRTTGLDTAEKGKLIKQFWDTINNRKKTNINILKDDDVETYDVKQVKKTSEENKRRKQAEKTVEESRRRKTDDHIAKIYEYLTQFDEAKTNDIANYIGLSASRTRVILSKMENVDIIGTNTNRRYKLKK